MRGVFKTRKSKGEIWAKLMQNSSFEIFYHLYHKISPGILLGRTLFIHSKILVLIDFNDGDDDGDDGGALLSL